MRGLVFFFCVWICLPDLKAQDTFACEEVVDLQQWGEGFVCSKRNDQLILRLQTEKNSLISDVPETEMDAYTVLLKHGATWMDYPYPPTALAMGFNATYDLGAVDLLNDSNLVFSLSKPAVLSEAGTIVHALNFNGKISNLTPVAVPPEGSVHIHPAISPDGSQIIFASNMPGGKGGFDLYYVNRLKEGWSEPVSLGGEINTSGNEVFPVWNGKEVCFSSTGHVGMGGMDLYRTSPQSQWQSLTPFPEPFNSAQDDFLPVWLSPEVCFLNSNRGGKDAVYRISKILPEGAKGAMSAVLECKGTGVSNAKVTIFNALGEVVVNDTTSQGGGFPIDDLSLNQKYKAKFENVPPEILRSSLLFILDALGNRIMVFAPGGDGYFYFELLDYEDEGVLGLMQNEDSSSLLSVTVEGQVYEEKPGDIGKGEPIYILDEEGEVMALAYTTAQGKFKFDELTPNATYSFQLDKDSNALNMVIKDSGSEIVIPVNEGNVVYNRVLEGEAVKLKNEKGENITIKSDELFVIQNIYYALNSSALNAAARYQLTQLAEIMRRNPGITIELGSHTDSRGQDAYNLQLSEHRAASAIDFLHSAGVKRQRMTGKGYGETKLLNDCNNDAQCSEEEHALNRRTEIRIIVPAN